MLLSKLTKKLAYKIILSKSQKQESQQILQRIKKRLQQLMNNQKKILTLSKTFQIFPSFFNFGIINEMIQSQFMEEYLNYIVIMKNNKDIHSKDQYVNKICQNLRITAIQDQRMLEVYINYVKRTKDLSQSQIIMEIFDIRYPENWFKSRQMGQRKFIYHYGPTNSGKTYSAINQLKNITQDQKGVYMAPLRLLAWQTHKKLGKCNLITGQEKDYQNSNITSCTIEAVKINQLFDVAIIDQIQMIGDKSRGWSWTAPILGLRANKIHLCGDQRALNLVAKLVQKSGGTLQQKSYTRLSKLYLVKQLFKLSDIRPGDCLIQFSSQKLYKLRDLINKQKNPQNPQSKTAIIYGKMPPACRKDQAQKFNNGQLPYLVASDAIGMGLNLNIRRIIFINLMKLSHDKVEKTLEDHQIRQIAGRAGRGYGHGYVQCVTVEMRDKVEYALRNVSKIVQTSSQKQLMQEDNQSTISPSFNNQTRSSLSPSSSSSPSPSSSSPTPPPPTPTPTPFTAHTLTPDQQLIQRAGIFFPISIIQRIKLKMQRILGYELKTSQTIRLITNLSKQNKQLYFVEYNEQLLELSDLLENQKLNFHIHYVFSKLPIPNNSSQIKNVVLQFAREFKRNGVVRIPEFILRDYQDQYKEYTDLSHIKILQDHYLIAQAYTWLWNHLQLYFPYNDLSNNIKQAICKKMNKLLSMPLLNNNNNKKKIKKQRPKLFASKQQQQKQQQQQQQEQKQNEDNEDNDDNDDIIGNEMNNKNKDFKGNGNKNQERNQIRQAIERQRKIDMRNRRKSKNIRLQ